MDQGTDPVTSPIEEHIEDTRRDLGANLYELQDRVETAKDWRYQFKRRPGAFLGVAFGGGLLLGKMTQRRRCR
jgi:hypothetical protein